MDVRAIILPNLVRSEAPNAEKDHWEKYLAHVFSFSNSRQVQASRKPDQSEPALELRISEEIGICSLRLESVIFYIQIPYELEIKKYYEFFAEGANKVFSNFWKWDS